MRRRTFLCTMTAASVMALAGAAASAATFADEVVSQLTSHGFSNINVETTWLGRMRITGNRSDGQREIILNPRTGEILRDTWQGAGNGAAKPIIDDVGDGSASGDTSQTDDNISGGGSNNSGTEPDPDGPNGKNDDKEDDVKEQ